MCVGYLAKAPHISPMEASTQLETRIDLPFHSSSDSTSMTIASTKSLVQHSSMLLPEVYSIAKFRYLNGIFNVAHRSLRYANGALDLSFDPEYLKSRYNTTSGSMEHPTSRTTKIPVPFTGGGLLDVVKRRLYLDRDGNHPDFSIPKQQPRTMTTQPGRCVAYCVEAHVTVIWL